MDEKRRFLLILAMIIVPITSAFIIRIPLTMATRPKMLSNAAVELLGEFRSEVESLPDEAFEHSLIAAQYRNALSNKIKAVINQVEAGALQGAIEKVNNDILDKISKWLLEPWRTALTEKVNEIIDLLGLYI